jgi:hypothetical protein
MKEASSESRKVTAGAISLALPIRLSSDFLLYSLTKEGFGYQKFLGETQITLILYFP